MRTQTLVLGLLASLMASGCTTTECAEGTIERDGKCEPSTGDPFSDAMCGDFTHLEGDRCVPDFPPVVCEGGMVEDDPMNPGVKICKGGGDPVDCGSALNCSTPSGATKQTICGQIYDFETGVAFREPAGTTTGVKCDPMMPATTGPCALQVVPYDALAFGMAPTTTQPLPHGTVTIDTCGRFRVESIETNGTSPFIGLGIDDAGGPLGNPAGVTVTTAVATPKMGMSASPGVEAFIVKGSTIAAWQGSGGPQLSGGIYAPVYRAHKLPVTSGTIFDNQAGVTVTKDGNPIMSNDFYFTASQTNRTMIDTAASVTGMNGTVLVTSAAVSQGVAYGGTGGLGAGCRWEPHAGASLPGIVFIQIFRKLDLVGQTCND